MSEPRPARRWLLRTGWALAWLLAGLATGWCVLALAASPMLPEPLAPYGAGAYGLAALAALVWVRPWHRAWTALAIGFLAVLIGYASLEPRGDRVWAPEYHEVPRVDFEGDRVTIHGIRNLDYRTETDFDERWETRSYDLSTLETADLSLTYWGSPLIAHTIVSFGFSDGRYLAASIETRRESHEQYSAIKGFFRQYELTYVFADERDLIGVRTNYRKGEEVYLYRMKASPERIRKVFLDYLRTADALSREPRFYNALTGNCTTNIRMHVNHSGPAQPWDWRLLANGKLDELLYERAITDTSLPQAELERLSWINERARAAGTDAEDFSRRIREGLPGMETTR